MKKTKQSEVLVRPPYAFPPSWGNRAEKTMNGEKSKHGGDRGERGKKGRPIVEVMCAWCGNYVPISKTHRHHGCIGAGATEARDLVAFFLRKAAISMQTLRLSDFSYGDYLHLLEMARWYNDKVGKPTRKDSRENAKTTE